MFKRFQQLMAVLLVIVAFCLPALAEDSCTPEQQDALEACKAQCVADSECVKAPIGLEEIRAAIDEKCDCETARNYGKYRSCVAKLLGSLRAFSLIAPEDHQAIKADNKECRSAIKQRRKEDKGNKGNKGKGKKKGQQ